MLNQYSTALTKGASVKNWLFTNFSKERYISEKDVDDIDLAVVRTYSTMEEYGQLKFAVRRAYEREVCNRLAAVTYEEVEMNQVYFPLEGDAVELSIFFHIPHIVNSHAKTYIHAEEAGTYHFLLRYSCYFKIWINGKELGTYLPKGKSVEEQISIELPLQAGENEILVYMEELAERDMFCYFQLTYLDEAKGLVASIPITSTSEDIEYKSKVLKSLSLESDLCLDTVRVIYDPSLLQGPLTIYKKAAPSSIMSGVEERIEDMPAITLSPDQNYFELSGLTTGAHKLVFATYSGDVCLYVKLLEAVYEKEYAEFVAAATIAERKKQVNYWISKSHNDFISTVLSILETEGEMTEEAERFLLSALTIIDEKRDCSDFRLLPIMIIYTKYAHLLSEELKAKIKYTILNFRYWNDEPGNDVMWFYSENHAMLFHACQYLAGEIFPDEIFAVSGNNGHTQREKGYVRLATWFDTFFKRGYDEWNSITYLPIDLIGFFSMYVMTEGEIWEWAKKGLDLTFEIMAGNMFHKRYGSAYARVYEEYLKGAELSELTLLSWIGLGQGNLNTNIRCAPIFCITDYEPPGFADLLNAKENGSVTIERKQGMHNVHTYLHKTKEYSLASALNYTPFTAGLQQSVMNVMIGEKGSTLWVNHPGEAQFSGERRPSYWAGNGTLPYIYQNKNTVIGVYNIDPEHLVDFVHAYIPNKELDEHRKVGNWLFAKQGIGYVGMWFSNDFTYTTEGANRDKEIISVGRNQAFVTKCGGESTYGSFEAFIEAYKDVKITYDMDKTVMFEDPECGKTCVNSTDLYAINGEEKSLSISEREKIVIA
ncbi:MAG: hypothetical protein R3Y47_00785 [Lachnospiraceae bacterium]